METNYTKKDLLPPCEAYSIYLHEASTQFKLPLDECRNKFGSFTIRQWEELLNGEIESLNNAINSNDLIGYNVHEYIQDDKRRTKKMYFLTDEKGNSITGHWYYSELNHFISGYGKAFKKFKTT